VISLRLPQRVPCAAPPRGILVAAVRARGAPEDRTMDFRFSPEDEAWRAEVRGWIRQEFGADWRGVEATDGEGDAAYAFSLGVRRRLAARGWTAPGFPREYGGLGASFAQQAIFNEELAYARLPGPDIISVSMLAPTLMVYGTPEQKQHLPRIMAAEETWCQGYSEPGSGSDLASLQTRAVRDGDDYVVNGQKIWTSNAHHADWMFLLARTDPDAPKHRGISYLLLDMKTPGIDVRPLINMAGGHGFNEVYFDNVRLPVANRVGEENRGWYVGTTTLDFERSSLAGSASLRRSYEELVEALRDAPAEQRHAPGRGALRSALTEIGIELEVSRLLGLRILSMQGRGQVPNYEASMGKLFAAELGQRFANLATQVQGLYGALRSGSAHARRGGTAAEQYMSAVPATIAGGTSEVQRNIIATRGLGLPRG
jgi:alkylation response protein AidB-like acyl-CoA dehydrogenase